MARRAGRKGPGKLVPSGEVERGSAPPREKVRPHSSSPEGVLRVAVAARPALFREALSRVLSSEPGLLVVGRASDENGIAEVLKSERPRVLLFDYEALGPNGEGLVARLRRVLPSARFLVLASRSGPDTVERVLRAGASGLVGKEQDLDTVVRAIRAVAAGEVWANRLATAKALEFLAGLSDDSAGATRGHGRLTRREAEIASEVGLGLRNKQIAGKLKISEKTVRTHLNNIFRKLQLDSRIALALLARDTLSLQPRS